MVILIDRNEIRDTANWRDFFEGKFNSNHKESTKWGNGLFSDSAGTLIAGRLKILPIWLPGDSALGGTKRNLNIRNVLKIFFVYFGATQAKVTGEGIR
jgi:hypothetical protein